MSPLLSVRSVSKRFRGLVAVDSVSFDVAPGAIYAVIGPNGAGKTTLFNLIAGVYPPDSGSVEFDGAKIDGLRPEKICAAGIARTFQIVKPFPGLTAWENATVGALLREPDPDAARENAGVVLRRLDLWDKRDAKAGSLTLPDRKRLEVARALATSPRLLLLDEVMAGLRPTETDRMVAILKDLARDTGVTILLIEHVMRAVMALAERILVLHHGAALVEGAPQDVVQDRRVLDSYLGAEALG
jgi:branched-chain amino acid transport system ATP-binding protein